MATEWPRKCAALRRAYAESNRALDALADLKSALRDAEFAPLGALLEGIESTLIRVGRAAEDAADLGECER